MTQLEQDMLVLRRMFEPWNTPSGGTVIWEPDAQDENGQFKRQIIDKAVQVIAAGTNALAGLSVTTPEFGETEFRAIEESLANDHEQSVFLELAVACQRVVHSIGQVAA